jgi:hypothetical protein
LGEATIDEIGGDLLSNKRKVGAYFTREDALLKLAGIDVLPCQKFI